MIALVAFSGLFLTLAGLVFITAPLLPRQGALASAHRRLELSGAFEKSASVICGALFLACGAGVIAWSAGIV
ncbi:hypothetical protein L2D00_02645 [Hyphomonadaceae bacterium BL14]|nr:hypothetical protein L2D00_02645 [Hyphomonadaceae bacterium BL14]